MTKVALRTWATPLTIGAFVLMAGTGLIIFFRFDNGVMAPAHRLFSWVFLIGALSHITANRRALWGHMQSIPARISVATFVAVLLASGYSWNQTTRPKLVLRMEQTLEAAPLTAIAALQGGSPEALISRLRRQGLSGAPGESVRQIASANRTSEERLLSIIFQSPE